MLVAAAAVSLAAVCFHATSIAVEESAAGQASSRDRLEDALMAHRLAPWRVEPLGLLASAALDDRQPEHTEVALAVICGSSWLRPRSAVLAALRARLAAALDQAPTAVAETWLAAAEQPSNPQYRARLDDLLLLLGAGGNDVVP